MNIEKLASFRNLLYAYYECRRGKRKQESAGRFELNYEIEILKLQQELLTQTWQPLRPFCFVVTDPKIREIHAADFRDRVVHHALCRLIIPLFEPGFIKDSYACRTGKGTHKCLYRLKSFIRKVTRNYTRSAYYLQGDILSFFTSINHDILLNQLKEKVKSPDIISILERIITPESIYNPIKRGQLSLFAEIPRHKSLFFAPHNQGLPIGNLTSQFFANVYLNQLDQYVKHHLRVKYYLRYVDDFIILENNPNLLKKYRLAIANFLQNNLLLKLHPKKQIIRPIESGIDFLGYFIKPHYTLVRRRVVSRLKVRLIEFRNDLSKEDIDWDYIIAVINAYYAHFLHADSYNLRVHLWRKHFGDLRYFLFPMNNFSYFAKKYSDEIGLPR